MWTCPKRPKARCRFIRRLILSMSMWPIKGYYFNQPNSDLVYKIDLQEMKVAQTIKGGTAPHGVAVSQDGKFVFVTNLLSDDLSVIDAIAGKKWRK